jgi:cysteinyl-tRNA synthetase
MTAPDVRLYNSMTQRLERLEPLTPGRVGVYACGMTTYDHTHAGHARTFTTCDVLVRFLRARGYVVRYVRNVTDIDDKILKRALEREMPPLELSRKMAQANADELLSIGCAPPDVEPRVSDSIDDIIAVIELLVSKGVAYVAPTEKGNDVYFSVRSFPAYGKLSHRDVNELQVGARVEVGESKRDPLDFALWKASSEGVWGWNSPWGKGRPGWHIECSAMAARNLSPHFDIHCGGMDLIFPHHENEIAQSEAAWGEPFARLWLHFGFVNVDAEKMSKSLGNFVTTVQILERNDPEALRYFFLGHHYRVPLVFDLAKLPDGRVVFPGIDEAEQRVEYLYSTREALVSVAAGAPPDDRGPPGEASTAEIVRTAGQRVLEALDNDLNTSVALSVIAELARASNDLAARAPGKRKEPENLAAHRSLARAAAEALDACCRPLGLMQASATEFFARTRERRLALRGLRDEAIEAKVKERAEARARKDFARADAIRAELAAMGVELQDAPGAAAASGAAGVTWRVRAG